MGELKIITNNVPRELVCVADIPLKYAGDFDYLCGDKAYDRRLVKYRNYYYDVQDTQRIVVDAVGKWIGWEMAVPPSSPFAKWQCVLSETFFSGVVFRFVEDNDMVVCGSYFS